MLPSYVEIETVQTNLLAKLRMGAKTKLVRDVRNDEASSELRVRGFFQHWECFALIMTGRNETKAPGNSTRLPRSSIYFANQASEAAQHSQVELVDSMDGYPAQKTTLYKKLMFSKNAVHYAQTPPVLLSYQAVQASIQQTFQ